MNNWIFRSEEGYAISPDGRIEVRAFAYNEVVTEQVFDLDSADGFGVYRLEDEVRMHVSDFLTYEAACMYAEAIYNIERALDETADS